jgi:chitin disaccharide deacetylase
MPDCGAPARTSPRTDSLTIVTLTERLGYGDDTKLLIATCDDLGTFHAANVATYRSLREGWATSASLVVPGPWAREAAARYRSDDVGVHLTINAEYELFRWGPITHAPSLLDGSGGFPRTLEDVWEHADIDEVRNECRAQIERAISWGFDVTHLDSHLGAMVLRPEFFDVALELAVEFALPLRLPDAATQQSVGFPFRDLAAEEGVVSPDHVVSFSNHATEDTVARAIEELRPGVTEFVFSPADDTTELRAIYDEWWGQVNHANMLHSAHALHAALRQSGVQLIAYSKLRELQRSNS